jgi:hypothetical protein
MGSTKKESQLFQQYNRLLHPARVRFMQSAGINTYMGEMNEKKLHAFLLVWTAFSIKMTEKVEAWIRGAGESCENQGIKDVGSRLKHHAEQESEHDLMLVDDLKVLIEKWNSTYDDSLEADFIKNFPLPQNTDAYVALHENAIKSKTPYVQVAIEYEIERMSVVYGPRMVENVINTLGPQYEAGIGFLAHHVLLDQGHTKFNADLLERCFTSNCSLEALVETGISALNIYSGFLDECRFLSAPLLESKPWTSQLQN